MIQTIEKPRLSPVKFVPENPSYDPRYNYRHMLETFFRLSIPEQEEQVGYFQKYQFNDRIQLQFHCSPTTFAPQIHLINAQLDILHTWNPVPAIALVGNLDPANSQQLTTYHYHLSFNDVADLPEGVYFLLFEGAFVDDVPIVKREVSEPIWVKTKHEGTILLEYTNETNDYHTVFEQTAAQFSLRVEGLVTNYRPGSQIDTYANQSLTISKLYGTQARKWALGVGVGINARGIPDYLLDKIDSITICDHWRAEGVEFVRDGGSNWEITEIEDYPMKAGFITMQPAKPNADTYTTSAGPVNLFVVPPYPFVVAQATLGITTPTIPLLANPALITNLTELTALVTALNAARGNYGLAGGYSNNAGVIQYANGQGEYFTVGHAVIHTSKFSYDIDSSLLGILGGTGFYAGNAEVVVNWGDGSSLQRYSFDSNLLGNFATHTYFTPPAVITVDVWGTLQAFRLNEPAVKDLVGVIPAGLQTLIMEQTRMPANTLNIALLAPCQASLRKLWFVGCALTNVNGFNAYNFPQLRSVSFSTNAFSTTVKSAMIYDIHLNASNNFIINGTLSVANQSTGAVLNGLGITYYNKLRSSPLNWNVAI